MTTERTDHAAEALNFLGATTFDTHGDDDRKVALAQVHATLALVEQQRIANLIAFTTAGEFDMTDDVAEQVAKDLGVWGGEN